MKTEQLYRILKVADEYVDLATAEIQKVKKELYEIIANHSKQPYEKVWEDSDRDYWMSAREAKEYGIIDEVLSQHNEK